MSKLRIPQVVVLGSNFIPSPHKRWISLSPVIHLFLLVHGNSTLSSLSLRTIYLRICQTSGCWCVSYRTWNPRLSRRPFELSRETARRVLEASLYPLGLQIFSSFQRGNRYPSFLTLIIDDGVRTWPHTFQNVNLSSGLASIVRRDRFLWKRFFSVTEKIGFIRLFFILVDN